MIEMFVIMAFYLTPKMMNPGVFYYTREQCVAALEEKIRDNKYVRRQGIMYGCVPVYKPTNEGKND